MFPIYPYINVNDLNLDYLQRKVKMLEEIVKNFVSVEGVKFADPIAWNITTQYAKNTVVLDDEGNAYLSIKPVPAGILLNNADFWLSIFNFMDYVRAFNSNVTIHEERNTDRATAAYSIGDWLLIDDLLYVVAQNIAIDDTFTEGTNINRATIEDVVRTYKNDIDISESNYRAQLAGDIVSATASLQAQLAAAIAGVTVDSEVINARIGADGVTYPTLGDAIRTQFEYIREPITVTWIPNTFVSYYDGSENTLVGVYSSTDYILIDSSSVYQIKTNVSADASGVCFYDAANNFISGYNMAADAQTLVTVKVPINAKKMRFTSYVAYTTSVEVYKCVTPDSLKPINDILLNYTEYLPIVDYEYERYIGENDGLPTQFPNRPAYRSTGKIEILPGDILVIYTRLEAGTAIAFYDSNNTPIQIIKWKAAYQNDLHEYKLVAPLNAKCVAVSAYNQPLENIYIKRLGNVYKSADIKKWAYSLWDVLCCGDSLTAGNCYINGYGGNAIDQNYPRMLGRMLDCNVKNGGDSGASTSQWYNNKMPTYTLTDYDTFIIWLGTNGGLTDTLATDVDPYVDYNDFATTETGYYCKIIAKIKDLNPDAMIVLINVYATSGDLAETNLTIEHIAQKYSLPVVDVSDLTYSIRPELHGNISNIHLGKAGNIEVAERVVRHLSMYFNQNPVLTEYGYTPMAN